MHPDGCRRRFRLVLSCIRPISTTSVAAGIGTFSTGISTSPQRPAQALVYRTSLTGSGNDRPFEAPWESIIRCKLRQQGVRQWSTGGQALVKSLDESWDA
jgi:hypothetical protein